jgi:hypothetical protein
MARKKTFTDHSLLSAMGTEPGFGPDGLVVGEIGQELDIPGSTLSRHLQKLSMRYRYLQPIAYTAPCCLI